MDSLAILDIYISLQDPIYDGPNRRRGGSRAANVLRPSPDPDFSADIFSKIFTRN